MNDLSLYCAWTSIGFMMCAMLSLLALEVFDVDAFSRPGKLPVIFITVAMLFLMVGFGLMLPSIFK